MREAMDEVEDAPMKRKRNPWTRTVSAGIAEDGGTVVIERDVFPSKRGEGRSAGWSLGVLELQVGEELVVEAYQ